MSETFFEKGKVGSCSKIIEDALKPSLSVLHSFDKKSWKWT